MFSIGLKTGKTNRETKIGGSEIDCIFVEQQWFLKNIFFVPKFAPRLLLLRVSGLNSIESEISIRKLLFLGRLLTREKMAPVVRSLFRTRSQSFFDSNIVSLGVIPSICEALHKYDLFSYFDFWFSNSDFPTYSSWKTIVKSKVFEFEENAWNAFVLGHPNLAFAKSCLELVPPQKFWSISASYPDLVCRLHAQIRLMGNFGLNAGIPWAKGTDTAICFICKRTEETLYHFLFDCPSFRENFDFLW